MALNEEKYQRRRLQTSTLTTVVSVTLVLYMLGLLSVILYHAKKVSDYVKENIGFTVMIHDQVKEATILDMKEAFEQRVYVKECLYVTKEEAAATLMNDLGEDFIGFLGQNPLLPSLEIRMNAAWANPDSLAGIEKQIAGMKEVREVVYQKSLVEVVSENMRKVSFVILGFSTLLLLISIALINNTIRLTVFSKRFLIKTMQLVGATEGFIRKPFLVRGIAYGLYGAGASLLLLTLTLYLANRQVPDLVLLQDIRLYLTLFGIVTLLGILISFISSFIAVRKFLRLRADLLY